MLRAAVLAADGGYGLVAVRGVLQNLDNLLGRVVRCLHTILHVRGA